MTSEMPVPQAPRHVVWRDADGRELSPHDWERQSPRTLQLLLKGGAENDNADREPPLLLLFNADERAWAFALPASVESELAGWTIELDTNEPTGWSDRCIASDQKLDVPGETLMLARAILPA